MRAKRSWLIVSARADAHSLEGGTDCNQRIQVHELEISISRAEKALHESEGDVSKASKVLVTVT